MVLSILGMVYAAELIGPGPVGGGLKTGDHWLALTADRLVDVSITVVEASGERHWTVPGMMPLALLRGEPLQAGPIKTYGMAQSFDNVLNLGDLRLERKGNELEVSDSERRQHLPLSDESRLLWAGDLDRDNHTDLILGHDGGWSLWLSAGASYLLREVGATTGC